MQLLGQRNKIELIKFSHFLPFIHFFFIFPFSLYIPSDPLSFFPTSRLFFVSETLNFPTFFASGVARCPRFSYATVFCQPLVICQRGSHTQQDLQKCNLASTTNSVNSICNFNETALIYETYVHALKFPWKSKNNGKLKVSSAHKRYVSCSAVDSTQKQINQWFIQVLQPILKE